MKKTVLKTAWLVVAFIAALFIISAVMNQGNTDMTEQMADATYPVILLTCKNYEVNCLHGYAEAMDISYMRDTILPVGEDRSISFSVETYGRGISTLAFEVRDVSGERLIENTVIEDWEKVGDSINCQITLKDLITPNEEYMLIFLVTPTEGDTIYYYTRMIQSEGLYIQEKLDFVQDFHDRTFDKEAAREITLYMESNSEGDNSSLHYVNIHSSFAQITWGDLDVTEVTDPIWAIRDLTDQTGVLVGDYLVSSGQGADKTYYQVEEYYRVRYTPERMYLLDYERTMDQIFEEEADVYGNDTFMLGIVGDDTDFAESDGGGALAFAVSGKLYGYHVAENKLARLFSFYDDSDITDLRCSYNHHDIKILRVDETGDVTFLVYGYMNRGRHEGEVGAAIYSYDSVANTLEEEVYIPYSRSYELLKNDLAQLSYLNQDGICYLLLDETVYAVSVADRSVETVVSDLTEDAYKISDSNQMLAWREDDVYDCTTIHLLNLGTGEESLIQAGNREYLTLIGFMGEDFIYGLTKQKDVIYNEIGVETFPMYSIKIQNNNGETLKTYRETGYYISQVEISGSQIFLNRIVWDAETETYADATDEQIVSMEQTDTGNNTLTSVAVDIYETIYEVKLRDMFDADSLKKQTPKEVLYEGNRNLDLAGKSDEGHYYVYAGTGLAGVYDVAGSAVRVADAQAGVVVDDDGSYIWRRMARSSRNQIMAIEGETTEDASASLAVCLNTILRFEGSARRTQSLLNQGLTAAEALETCLSDIETLDLTGCSLDAILYYVNLDIPVLVQLADGTGVLVTGFNETQVVIMNPLAEEPLYKISMTEAESWFTENGNHFLTYLTETT